MAELLLSSGKREVLLNPPLLNAAGTLGFAQESAELIDLARLGALITNPVSLRPRSPANDATVQPLEGGLLLHSGLPNAGLERTLSRYRSRWSALPCPLIVHLIGTPPELEEMVLQLEAEPAVSGLEIGLEVESEVEATARLARNSELPVVLRLPLDAPAASFQRAAAAGAQALSMGPPRGAWPAVAHGSRSGRLYGPALFPLALAKVQQLHRWIDVPILAAGGIQEPAQIEVLLQAGAVAVQLDYALWLQPENLLRQDPAQA